MKKIEVANQNNSNFNNGFVSREKKFIDKFRNNIFYTTISLFTLLLMCSQTMAATYYASPNGRGDGSLQSTPFKIENFWDVALPSDVLYLLDGIYTDSGSMICPPSNVDGTKDRPITISALNDGKATIDGKFSNTPVKLYENDWFVIEKINICNAGSKNNGRVLWLSNSNNNIIRKVVGWDADPMENSYIFHASYGSNNLFEDCAGWGTARKIFSQHHEDHTTFRRCFFRWTYASCADNVGGSCFSMGMTYSYACTNSIVENCIGTWDEQGYPTLPDNTFRNAIFGVDATIANGGYKILGNIAYHLSEQKGPPRRGFNFIDRDPNTNYNMKDCIAYSENEDSGNFQLLDMSFTASNITSVGSGYGPGGVKAAFNLDKQIGTVDNCIVQNSNNYGVWYGDRVNYIMVHNNVDGNFKYNTPMNYSTKNPDLIAKCGNILQYGCSEENRPKVGTKSVGAKIEHRYVDGTLTKTDLWPWPMNDRIKEAMIQSGYDKIGGVDGMGGIDLTKTIFELGGGALPVYKVSPPQNLRIFYSNN